MDGLLMLILLNGGNTPAHTLGTEVVITDADMLAAGNMVNWTKNNTYILDGFVFVNDGQTLNIQAGTVIQGKPGEGSEASALVVAQRWPYRSNGNRVRTYRIFTFEGDLKEELLLLFEDNGED